MLTYADYKIHPLADAFPLIEGEDFDQFVKSVAQHGLREPIVMREDVLIDGRNRLRACLLLGIDPRFQEYDQEMEVHDFIWVKNVARRHLDSDKLAVLGTRLANYVREEARRRQLSKLAQNVDDTVPLNSAERQEPTTTGDTRDILAKKVGVSRDKMQQALNVRKHDEKNGTDLARKVETGEMTLRAATRAIEGVPKQSKRPKEERTQDIGELTAKGYRAEQIAAQLGISEQQVRKLAHEAEIVLVDAVIGKRARLDVNRIVGETVLSAHTLTAGLDLIGSRLEDLDRSRLAEWVATLSESISALNKLLRTLRRIDL